MGIVGLVDDRSGGGGISSWLVRTLRCPTDGGMILQGAEGGGSGEEAFPAARAPRILIRMPKPIMDLRQLTVAERIQLAVDLWDSISEAPEILSLTDTQREELERRLEAYRSEPDATISWGSLRQELLQG